MWHQRLGHINPKRLKLLAGGMAKGISFPSDGIVTGCEACAKGKAHKKKVSREPRVKAEELLGGFTQISVVPCQHLWGVPGILPPSLITSPVIAPSGSSNRRVTCQRHSGTLWKKQRQQLGRR